MKFGDYSLGGSVTQDTGLMEISFMEKMLLKKTFPGEEIKKAPPATFLGAEWTMILGIVGGRIWKLSGQFSTDDLARLDEVMSDAIHYCQAQFGEGVNHPALNAHRWTAAFGNVVVDRHSAMGSHVINFHATLGNSDWKSEERTESLPTTRDEKLEARNAKAFRIGEYALGETLPANCALKDSTPPESSRNGVDFVGQRKRTGAKGSFLGREWDLELETLNDHIYRISARLRSSDPDSGEKTFIDVENLCLKTFGSPLDISDDEVRIYATPFGRAVIEYYRWDDPNDLHFCVTSYDLLGDAQPIPTVASAQREAEVESTDRIEQAAPSGVEMLISEESGPHSSLISRIRCGAFLLMIYTSEKRPMAGLETSVGIMPYETATPEETRMAAEIIWPVTADKPTKHRLHRLLTGALAEGYCETWPVKEWQLGLGFEGAMVSMQRNGLVRSYTSDFSTDRLADDEEDDASTAIMPPEEKGEAECEELESPASTAPLEGEWSPGALSLMRNGVDKPPPIAKEKILFRARNWQECVILVYPKVGVAGTRENKSFVAAYKRRGTPETALDIANDLRELGWPVTIPGLEDIAPDVDRD